MTVGALPTAMVAWLVSYLIMHRIVAGYQTARRRQRIRRQLRRRAKARGVPPHKGPFMGSREPNQPEALGPEANRRRQL